MKKSNILLICLLAFIIFTGFSSNLILKREFEKIDRSNPLAAYKASVLKPVKFINVRGAHVGLTRIQGDTSWKLLTRASEKSLTWRVQGDTLTLTYADHPEVNTSALALQYRETPITYLMVPTLSGIQAENVPLEITKIPGQTLTIHQSGGKMQLKDLQIENLAVDLTKGGTMEIDNKNKIGTASVVVKQSGRFSADHAFNNFDISVDSSARVSLPGAVLKKLLRP